MSNKKGGITIGAVTRQKSGSNTNANENLSSKGAKKHEVPKKNKTVAKKYLKKLTKPDKRLKSVDEFVSGVKDKLKEKAKNAIKSNIGNSLHKAIEVIIF